MKLVNCVFFLKKHKSLGYLENMEFPVQKSKLSKIAGRQLLVALYEATMGKKFTDIIFDEYNSISSAKAKSLYLTVSILHSIGLKTRAGLISRVHGISFNSFKEELFKPLEYIVFSYRDDIIFDYIYRTRHSHIAKIIFERVLTDQNIKYDEIARIINHLDVDYRSDQEAFHRIMNYKTILELFQNPDLGRSLYRIAKQ